MSRDISLHEALSFMTQEVLDLLPVEIQAQVKPILWHGAQPCSECGGTIHSKYEVNASAWVCAGCYNDFAEEKGWESKPLSIEEKAVKYDELIAHLRYIKDTSSIGDFIEMSSDLLEDFA